MERSCTMEENRIDFVKWLRVLIYIAIAGLVNTFIGIPSFVPSVITSWISRILMAVMVFAMFKLATANDRYKKAGIQRAIVLALTIATDLLHSGAILTLIAGTLAIVADYQEYHGHSELIEENDHQLYTFEGRFHPIASNGFGWNGYEWTWLETEIIERSEERQDVLLLREPPFCR